MKADPIEVKITHFKQQLPVEMDRFWSSSENKMGLQQMFINWMIECCRSEIPVFLGGANTDDITSCLKLCNGERSVVPSLSNDHEEADDRIMYHVSQSISEERFEKVIVASPDTDVFVCSVYHFKRWIFNGLNELWVVSGRSGTTVAFPVHDLAERIAPEVIDILPAVHALTGCDTTSKIGTKTAALKVASGSCFGELSFFGVSTLNEELVDLAQHFMVHCISKDKDVIYYKKSQLLDLEKLPPTSSSAILHIKRSYLQTYVWLHAPFVRSIDIDPTHYGYVLDEEGDCLKPKITEDDVLPDDLPQPCNCLKCARANVCICRINNINCCQYCNCKREECQNPFE
ncbi:uncharacterized protein LOC130636171 isoform X2 [Hydractinia symbiolongicarpus]|uniref:uncharacterized protein LOC130636171 isoform X2 n=1 Tax=Hydractinia symbiolongicarpus TaxID=13093 RepID=UPI00254F9F20|nr:uncharacterized protein LOC130636171 isoform X2 [Hydractinia symbiolongicarpus]